MPVDMRPWRLTADQILAIARRKGRFCVPRYLWRADEMARRCAELAKAGHLRRDRRQEDRATVVWVPADRELPVLAARDPSVRCPYCDAVLADHMAYVAHVRKEHEPSMHGKRAHKRERARYAAAHATTTTPAAE